jgi:uncharacterized protein
MSYILTKHNQLSEISPADWLSLTASAQPFFDYQFLTLLESSGAVASDTGWQAQHYVLRDTDNKAQAIMPLYQKSHSYGEYLFDWDWAEQLTQSGIAYYPKWVAQVPFTPVTGERLLGAKAARLELIKSVVQQATEHDISNVQCLYLNKAQLSEFTELGFMPRYGYEFIWRNKGYHDFDDFLSESKSKVRKKIRQERRNFSQANITIEQCRNEQITSEYWQFFIKCYQMTYLKRSGHFGYLPPNFWQLIKEQLAEQLLLVVAKQGGKLVASALFFTDDKRLYGRYWGALEQVPYLHFECCYYQAIEYCINHQLQTFLPGTQGEHKRWRGFEPRLIYGAYQFSMPQVQDAVENYLALERKALVRQVELWQENYC